MSGLKGIGRDLGNALLITIFSTICLLAVLIALSDLTGSGDDRPTAETEPDPPAARVEPADQRQERRADAAPGVESTKPPAADTRAAGIPVLCHHFLRPNAGPFDVVRITGALFLNLPIIDDMDVWTQTASEFERQMAYLYDKGYEAVGLDDVMAWRMGLRVLPERSVVITFDDGDRSVLELAYPILRNYGFKATLFVVTGRVGMNWDRIEGMTWDELRFLQNTGVFSIQSHTHNMHTKVKTKRGKLPVFLAASYGFYEFPGASSWRRAVLDDLRESRHLIERHLGKSPRFLAWPYGFGNTEVDSLAVLAGFDAICTLEEGAVERLTQTAAERSLAMWAGSGASAVSLNPLLGSDPLRDGGYGPDKIHWDAYKVKRYTITARTSIRSFEKMVSP